MRLFTGIAATLVLAGCHAAEAPTAQETAQPDPNAVLAELGGEQDAEDDAIANDSAADNDDTDTASKDDDGDDGAYSCDNGMKVQASYQKGGGAMLTIAGKTYTLASIAAASGAKYHSDTGLAPGKQLAWWTKDNGAMLIQSPAGTKAGSDQETTANCLAIDPETD